MNHQPPHDIDYEAVNNEAASVEATDKTSSRVMQTADIKPLELHALSEEIVGFFYNQAIASEDFVTEEEICRAFADILLRHWHLCSVVTLLDTNADTLRESSLYADTHINKPAASRAAHLLAACVKREGGECQFWLNENDFDEAQKLYGALPVEELPEARDAFTVAGVSAGIAVPIHARKRFIGAFVALCKEPAQLREAIAGIRFVAAPIVIALSNAQRTHAMREQQRHIEHLVEDLQAHGNQLEDANRELQRVARYRSMFLARMSHELRTPLTSVLGFTEIMLDQEDLTATQRRYCEKIQSSGLQQQESLNQLVDLSRLEAGQSELFLHEFSLRECVREVSAAVNRLAKKADVTIERANDTDTATIVSDEGKLRQVLYNFLAFAISRTPSGGRVHIAAEQKDATNFRIIISDSGERLRDPSHIFEAFDAMEANEHGTTLNELGLVIAHRLLQVLGGKVTLEDIAPQGLRVVLDFALALNDGEMHDDVQENHSTENQSE